MGNIHDTTLEIGLTDLVDRAVPPRPWEEGDKIPWDEPEFSRRMLREHLTDRHDMASPRPDRIDEHVKWIHRDLLSARPTKVLDLGCGPGLYTSRLARLGHDCVGIDFGPASVEYARKQADREGLACRYVEEDLRVADWGDGYGLVMMLHGEFNTFRPGEARDLVAGAHACLREGGMLLLVVTDPSGVEAGEDTKKGWFTASRGLFSALPHVGLKEEYWDAESRTRTTRWYIIDAASGRVRRYAETLQSWDEGECEGLLLGEGFAEARRCRSPECIEGLPSVRTILGRKARRS